MTVGGGVPAIRVEGERRSTHSLFFRGSVWALFDYGTSQLLRLVSNIVLWRLLTAEAFGLMNIVTAVMVGLAMFSDVGIGPSIVQHRRGEDPSYLNTAWTIQVLRGCGLAVLAALLAVPVARFFHQPELVALMGIVALTPLCGAFNSTRLFSAQRRVALRQVTLVDVGAQVAGTAVMLVVAWLTRSVRALALSWVVTAVVKLLLSHTALPGIRNRFRWERVAVDELIHFGRWIFLSTMLTFLAIQSDRLIFGKVLPIAYLGIYGIASVWATIPGSVLSKVFGGVGVAVLSQVKNRGGDVASVFRETREKVLMAGGWATTGLITGAGALVRLLYDERAADAIWIIPILAIGGWFAALENSNSAASLSLGHPKWMAAANGAKVIGMAVLVPLGAWKAGFFGAVVGLTVADVLKYLVSAIGVARVGAPAWTQDLVVTAGIAAVSLGTMALREVAGASHLPAIADAALVTVVVTGGWGLALTGVRIARRRRDAMAHV